MGEYRDGIAAVGGYIDLFYQYCGEGAYSYVYDGQLGYLDYASGSLDLMDEIVGTAVLPINADEPDLIACDMVYEQDP